MKWILRFILPVIGFCLMGASNLGSVDTKARRALNSFANKISREYQLEFLNSGWGGLTDSKEGIWSLSLVCRRPMTLDQGRQLATEITQKFLETIFNNPIFAQYCQLAQTSYRGPELKKEFATFRLAFWDENTNRPQAPFLAQIRFSEGNLYYYFADPVTQALQPPIIETVSIPFGSP